MCSFLLGFKKQFKNMTRARRRIAAGIYVGMMVVTIVGGFLRWPGPILILCVFIQVRAVRSCRPACRISTLCSQETCARISACVCFAAVVRGDLVYCLVHPGRPEADHVRARARRELLGR